MIWMEIGKSVTRMKIILCFVVGFFCCSALLELLNAIMQRFIKIMGKLNIY